MERLLFLGCGMIIGACLAAGKYRRMGLEKELEAWRTKASAPSEK